MTWHGPESVWEVRRDRLEGWSFGAVTYTLYESCSRAQASEAPFLFVWLHGQDYSQLSKEDIRIIRTRLGRHLFCLVPKNPQPTADGRQFFWGLGFTREQDRNGLGFVFGELCSEFLSAFTSVVRQIASEVGAVGTLVGGYSMGGFGALQLGSHAPKLFNAVIMVAGHGLGTLESQDGDSNYGAPQPQSSKIFKAFLAEHAPRLAKVSVVIAVHAPRDKVSSFADAKAIVEAIQCQGGHAEMVPVPDDMADSDLRGRKKHRRGHCYYNYAMVYDTSDEVLYSRLKARLQETLQVSEDAGDQANEVSDPSGDAGADLSQQLAGDTSGQGVRDTPQADLTDHVCGDLISQAEERLRRCKNTTNLQIIHRLKCMHSLSDEVELGLRMLEPTKLKELLRAVHGKLAGAMDKNEVVHQLIAEFDAEVESLVRGLLEVNMQNTSEAQDDAVPTDGAEHVLHEENTQGTREAQGVAVPTEDAEHALAEAKARLEGNKNKADIAAVQSFVEECGFGDSIELALRMLAPEHLQEILSGENEIILKLAGVDDPEKSMMWLISQLDPGVESLVARLLELDGQQMASGPVVTDGPQEAELAPGPVSTNGKVGPQVVGSEASQSAASIKALRRTCGFGEEAELALRLLTPAGLQQVLADKDELERQLVAAPDKNQHVLKVISQLDPSVEATVHRFLEAQGKKHTKSEVSAAVRAGSQRNRSRSRGRGPGGGVDGPPLAFMDNKEAVAEAEKRLEANRHTPNVAAVRALRADCGFGDEAELALRMLPPATLRKALLRKADLQRDIAAAVDQSEFILDLVSKLDPTAGILVRRCLEIDGTG
eukprot:CAMPEP_0179199986 /NCGR_PEP_ID=MMETSP0796-20121207/99505_1 /TAXON_ID=73915 /ORGANISM="Pyrodinium bahamense, Strain pbaha01" /LENGTH=825 /DNA_ID=CAMNT_0020904499 /DNA_START=72 /DNA_END=2546 /DNA_ORIENTATION=+